MIEDSVTSLGNWLGIAMAVSLENACLCNVSRSLTHAVHCRARDKTAIPAVLKDSFTKVISMEIEIQRKI